MAEKYLVKPSFVVVIDDGSTTEPRKRVDLDEFIRFLINNDVRFNSDGAGIRASVRIEEAQRRCQTLGAIGPLETDDQRLLLECAKNPKVRLPDGSIQGIYPVAPARRCAVWIDAIENARDQPPPETTASQTVTDN
jgi:hypothetical protein